MVWKIRFHDASDSELVDAIKKKTGDECSPPQWTTTSTPQVKSKFPENTVAVVVDVKQQVGALRIFTVGTGKYLDGVGTEEKGKMVIIPWESDWNYDTIGSLRFGPVLRH